MSVLVFSLERGLDLLFSCSAPVPFPCCSLGKKILTLSGRGVRTYTERNGLLGRTKPSFVRRHTGTISSSFMRFLPHPRLKLAFLPSSFLASRDKVVHLQWNKKSCTMMRPDAEQFFLFLLEEALPWGRQAKTPEPRRSEVNYGDEYGGKMHKVLEHTTTHSVLTGSRFHFTANTDNIREAKNRRKGGSDGEVVYVARQSAI